MAMRTLLLSTVAVVGLSAGALAADLPARAAPPPPIAAIPAFTWTGFYVGVNAGYAWQDNDNDPFGANSGAFDVPLLGGGLATYTLANPNPFLFGNNTNDDAFAFGAQVGYNYQVTPGSGFVFGVEADIQGLFGNDDDNTFFGGAGSTFFGVAPTAAGTIAPGFGVAPPVGAAGNLALFDNAFHNGNLGGSGLDWFGTLRARAGYAFDRILVYATGGLAYGGGGDNNNAFFVTNAVPGGFYISPAAAAVGAAVTPTNFGGFGSNDDLRWGWTLGGGVEWAFTDSLTFKLEGLYVNLDEDNNNAFAGTRVVGVSNTGAPVTRSDFGFFNNNNENEFFVLRGGLNFKFNTF
jgi:outer membrane immunogenic protein